MRRCFLEIDFLSIAQKRSVMGSLFELDGRPIRKLESGFSHFVLSVVDV
jgi:hypothetical protein